MRLSSERFCLQCLLRVFLSLQLVLKAFYGHFVRFTRIRRFVSVFPRWTDRDGEIHYDDGLVLSDKSVADSRCPFE